MDSEDEREIEEEIAQFALKGYRWIPDQKVISLRLYERTERRLRRCAYGDFRYGLCRAKRQDFQLKNGQNITVQSAGRSQTVPRLPERVPCDTGDILRVRRFFHTFKGFHIGYLDLTGRHERRYNSLASRMSTFLEDINQIRPSFRRIQVTYERFGIRHAETHYKTSSSSAERMFKTKYKLCDINLEEIFQEADDITKLFANGSQPVFQRLGLVDLPYEILCLILQSAVLDEARLLSATCRVFWKLGAPYTLRTRTLKLRAAADIDGDLIDGAYLAYDGALAVHRTLERGRFLDECAFLLSRPDIIKRIRELSFINELAGEHLIRPGPYGASLFAPIRRGIEDILHVAKNVTYLRFDSIRMSNAMFAAMAGIPTLRTLYLSDCSSGLDSHLESIPRIHSLLNLTLRFTLLSVYTVVSTACLFPNVRSIVFRTGGCNPMRLPVHEWQAPHNPFLTVERVHLEHLAVDELPRLTGWLRNAAAAGPLRLTHLKISQRPGHVLNRDTSLELISALRGASLQVLVLSGLSYVGQELFQTLFDVAPGLCALTLVFRRHSRQSERTLSRWPETTYQYASYLAAFPRLQYFAWNFNLKPIPEGLPCDLPLIERRCCGAVHGDGFDLPEDSTYDPRDDVLWNSDWECLAKLFAAHVPTLKSLIFLASFGHIRFGVTVEYKISRGTNGKVSIKTHERSSHHIIIDMINPPSPLVLEEHPWTTEGCISPLAPTVQPRWRGHV